MATNKNELDLTLTKSNAVVGGQRNGNRKQKHSNGSSSNRNPHLPLPAGGSGKPSTSASSNSINTTGTMEKRAKPAGRSSKQQQQPQHDKIFAGMEEFRSSREYMKLKEKLYTNQAQLDRANAWIRTNEATIGPECMSVCVDCDAGAQFELCSCYLTAPAPGVAVIDAHQHLRGNLVHRERLGILRRGLYDMMSWEAPHFDFETQNNQMLSGFHNKSIGDDRMLPDLYNFITVNMNVTYTNSAGFNDRALRIEHCRRLASRFADTHQWDLSKDTVLANRYKFTIQRACDQAENDALYQETKPGQSFWQAWSPQSPEAWRRFLILVCILLIAALITVAIMCSLVSHIASSILGNIVVHTLLAMIRAFLVNHLQLGSMHVLWFVIGTKITICALAIVWVIKKVWNTLKRSKPSTRR